MKTKLNGILTLLLAFVVHLSFAQKKTISGNVTDQDGLPLPGVNIVVKGTTSGTQTDFDGNYAISASEGQTLLYSYIGQKDAGRTVGNINTINIQMEEDAQALEEVIVVGAFGIKKQARSIGYATTQVSNEELTEVINSNPLESLSGKVAGVDITAPAQPGASIKVISRGFGSITGSNKPLYIVDGSPILDRASGSIVSTSSFDAGSGVSDIDPNNIENLTFLKGAAASALYGSRAANGAIIITTKKGKGKIKVNVTSSIDFGEVSRLPNDQQEFGTGWAGSSFSNVSGEGSLAASNENGSWGAAFNGEVRPWSRIIDNQQLIKPYNVLENNKREFFDIGNTYTNSISISGGGESSDMAFTYSRVDSDGVFPTKDDAYLKNNFGVNAGFRKDKFRVRVSANYIHKNQNAIPTGQSDDASFGKSLIQEIIQIPNDLSIVDLENQSNIFNTPSNFYTPYAANPYVTLESNKIFIEKDRFFGNVNLGYDITDNFGVVFQVGGDIEEEKIKRTGAIIDYVAGSPQDNAGANGVVGAVGEYEYTNRELDTYLNFTYNKEINSDLNINALIGFNFNQREGNSLSVLVTDLDLPNYYELSNSAATPTLTQNDYLKRVLGIYGSTELAYKNKYFLTLTARNDMSSTLPIQNNSYFYPGASLAAVVIDTQDTFLKLRGGFARIGNDTNTYEIYSTAGQSTNDAYFGDITYPLSGVNANEVYGRIENQDLKPEITDEIEIGLESFFFNSRLGLDVSLYNRDTKDLIVDLAVPRSTGYSTITGNFVDLTNKGIELTLRAKPILTDNFKWDLTYTFSKNESEVTDVAGDQDKISIYSAYSTNFYAEKGKPLGVFYGPTPDTNDAGQIIANPNTGYYTYDGEEDYLGSSQRDFIMGLNNSFTYKNFNFKFHWDWKQGGEMYSYTKRLNYFVGNAIETTYNGRSPFIIPNSVVDNGDGTYSENTNAVAWDDVTAFYNTSQNQAIENQHIIDKSFVRLRSMSFSYKLKSDFLDNVGLSALSFTVYGKNLFLWTPSDNSYVDPETSTYGRGIRSEFGEFATNPSQRAYGGIIKLSF